MKKETLNFTCRNKHSWTLQVSSSPSEQVIGNFVLCPLCGERGTISLEMKEVPGS